MKKLIPNLIIAVGLILLIPFEAFAESPELAEKAPNKQVELNKDTVTSDALEADEDEKVDSVWGALKYTGRKIQGGAKITGKSLEKGAKATGRGIKKGAKATEKGAKKAGKKIKEFFIGD